MKQAKIIRVDHGDGKASYQLKAGYHGNGERLSEWGFIASDPEGQYAAKIACIKAAGKYGYNLDSMDLSDDEMIEWIAEAYGIGRCRECGWRDGHTGNCSERFSGTN